MTARAELSMPSRTVMALLLVGVVSLSLKVIFERQISYPKMQSNFMDSMDHALVARGFKIIRRTDPYTTLATKGACYVFIGTARPEGGDEPYFVSQYGSRGILTYWYRGALTPTMPGIRAMLDRNIDRLMMAVGSPVTFRPIYHIVYGKPCSAEDLRNLPLDEGL